MAVADILRKMLRVTENLLFSPHCVFCNRVLELNVMNDVCGKCVKPEFFCNEKPCCVRCGKPLVGFGEKRLCYFCVTHKTMYFKRIVSVFEYTDVVRESILRYKLHYVRSYAKTYAELMAARFYEEYWDIDFDFVCGAPSHMNIERQRGFDHTGELCSKLSDIISLPYISGVLEKTEKTKRQSELSYEERRKNLERKIRTAGNTDIKGKTVLLVDDICTTRSTIIECARALRISGAKEVYALTLATTVRRD